MDMVTVGLGAAVVGLVFKDRIKTAIEAIKQKIRPGATEALIGKLDMLSVLERSRSERAEAELNHIKGQLQEVLQAQKQPVRSAHEADFIALFERLNGLAKDVNDTRGGVEYIQAVVQASEGKAQDELYVKSLAGITSSMSTLIERQASTEKLLVGIVELLNNLTQRTK